MWEVCPHVGKPVHSPDKSADVTAAIVALVSAVRSRDVWAAAVAAQALIAAVRGKITPEAVATITTDVRAILDDLGMGGL